MAAPLMMMIGLPGSGKSTWARAFVAARPDYRLISTDSIRRQLYGDEAIQGEWLAIWRQLTQSLQGLQGAIAQGEATGVIYDATNVRRRHRREFIEVAQRYGYAVEAVWIDTPLSVCLARNQGRSRQVPPSIIEKMHRQLTAAPPSVQEGLVAVHRTPSTERPSTERPSTEGPSTDKPSS